MGSPARKDDMSSRMETSSSKDDVKSSDSPRQNISFKFTKSSSKKLLGNKLDEDEIPAKSELVTSVEDKEIKSAVPKEEKKELVIPLIRKNTWRITGKSGDGLKGNLDDKERALHELALKEVLKESSLENDKWDKRESQTDIMIPLVVQNKVPDGFETDMKIDVSLRPEESTLEDYERVPVDAFGMAILRGMGWKPGEAIGGKNKELVKPVEVVVRPKGLGLGADKQASKKPAADQLSDEKLELLKKSYVHVIQGTHKGLYGQVEGLDDENARAIVKLVTIDKCITLPEFFLEVVSKKEFQKESKVINKLAYDKYLEEKGRQKNHENGQSHDKDHENTTSKRKDVDQSTKEMSNDSRETSHHKKRRKHSKERKVELLHFFHGVTS